MQDADRQCKKVVCISGAIRLFGSLLYIPAIRYFSRRGLLCISSFLMGVSLILLGLAVYSHHSKDSALRDTKRIGRYHQLGKKVTQLLLYHGPSTVCQ